MERVPPPVRSKQHFVPNGEGWSLSLHQAWDPAVLRRDQKPVLIVPGYGMNSFIFGYHPRGRSFEAALVRAGLEVWRVDLRGQGETKNVGGSHVYGLEDFARTDLTVAIDAALDRTETTATSAAVIGASLGGTIMFAHAALVPDHHVGAMVSMSGPVRWMEVHPFLRMAFASPRLVGAVPIRGSRLLARAVLPHILTHAPWLLSMYMHREHVDLENIGELAKTVEDPNRHVNRQIAEWMLRRDLVLGSTNVTDALPTMTTPLLSVFANADGIVSRKTAEYAHHHVGSSERRLVEVGSREMPVAHADMFISDHADALVYSPIRDWLLGS